jgi:hypothetical protein
MPGGDYTIFDSPLTRLYNRGMLDLTGKTLGQYQIIEEIGRGGMSIVYRAFQTSLNRYVALKVLPPQMAIDQDFVARFQREAIAAAGLRHPNIVVIHDVGGQDGLYYIVMEYLTGVTLGKLLQSGGPLPVARVIAIMRQVASALDYAHAHQLIHRDIKPSNIMIDEHDQAKLMDFGVARAGDSAGLTRTGMIVGTPEYMSPEQAQGVDIDHRSDLYSFGVVLYEMLTGHVPFERKTPHAVLLAHISETPPALRDRVTGIAPRVEAVVQRMLAKDPAQRYPNATVMVDDLARAVGGTPATVPALSPAPPAAAALGASGPAAGLPAAPATSGQARTRRLSPALIAVLVILLLAAVSAGGALATGMISLGGALPAPSPTAPVLVPAASETPTSTGVPTTAATPAATALPPTNTPAPTDTPVPASDTPTPGVTLSPTAGATTPAGTPSPAASATTAAITPSPAASATARPVTPSAQPPAATATRTAGPTGTPIPAGTPAARALFNMETFGTWRRGDQPNGTFTQSSEQAHTGQYSGKLIYNFASGDDYVVFLRSAAIAGAPNRISAWVYGDNSGHFLNVWVQDQQGEVWAVPLGRVYFSGWRQMVGRIDVNQAWPWGHVSGPGNNAVDYPISFYALVYDPETPRASTIYLDDVQVYTDNAPPPTAISPTPSGATPAPAGYSAPVPLAPGEDEIFRLPDITITLAWTSVGALRTDECYQVSIPHSDGVLTDYTTGTTYNVPAWLYSYRFDDRRFEWTVRVARCSDGTSLSPPSAPRHFYWFTS